MSSDLEITELALDDRAGHEAYAALWSAVVPRYPITREELERSRSEEPEPIEEAPEPIEEPEEDPGLDDMGDEGGEGGDAATDPPVDDPGAPPPAEGDGAVEPVVEDPPKDGGA